MSHDVYPFTAGKEACPLTMTHPHYNAVTLVKFVLVLLYPNPGTMYLHDVSRPALEALAQAQDMSYGHQC